jgi:hypothetical protein
MKANSVALSFGYLVNEQGGDEVKHLDALTCSRSRSRRRR